MTPQQIIGLGIRIRSIWLAITCFKYAVQIPAALKNARFWRKGDSGLRDRGCVWHRRDLALAISHVDCP